MTTYYYSISNDTLNGKVAVDRLREEILSHNFLISLNHINTFGDTLSIVFNGNISTDDKTDLDGIVANHNGEKLAPEPQIIKVKELESLKVDSSGNPIFGLSKPVGDYSTIVSHNFCDKTTWADSLNSAFEIKPLPGEILYISKSEVQFAHDLAFQGKNITLNYYVWHPSYPGAPVVGESIIFNSIYSIFEVGNAHWHSPAIGAEVPHGLTTIEFNQKTELKFFGDEPTDGSVKLHKLEIKINDDSELFGEYVTASFITTKESA